MPQRSIASDPLPLLLCGDFLDPDGGPPIKVPVQSVRIERSLRDVEADLVSPLALGRRLAVVSDRTTRAVLGERIERALGSVADVVAIVLEGTPHPDAHTVHWLEQASREADALIAVGSGTINDLCKYAAARAKKRYAVFATAPSMNGYTSMNAAITVDGHKKSLPAAAPVGVFIDLEVFAAAPPRMIRAGLGDSLCRSTAQVDWLLSHHITGTPFRSAPFAMLAQDETPLMEAPEALLRGDLDAMRALARTLVLSGLGMTICGGSYPASQGEHLISHYIDMFAPVDRATFFHGEQVAVATLTAARIQEALLDAGATRLRASSMTQTTLQDRLGAEIGAQCWSEFLPKRLSTQTAMSATERVTRVWNRMSNDVRGASVPASKLEAAMRRAGVPTTPAEIGVSDELYAAAVRDARYLRDRYTCLDLADDTGLLDRLLPS